MALSLAIACVAVAAAFGAEWKSMPPVTGIAAGNDTDQTGETVTAWFGGFRLEGWR